MSFNYAASAETARRLVENFGKPVKLVRRDTAAAASDRPWEGNSTLDSERTVQAVFVSDSGLGNEVVSRMRRSIRGGETRRSVLVAAADPGWESGDKPEMFDELHDGDDVWGVSLFDGLDPAGTPILYDYTIEASR